MSSHFGNLMEQQRGKGSDSGIGEGGPHERDVTRIPQVSSGTSTERQDAYTSSDSKLPPNQETTTGPPGNFPPLESSQTRLFRQIGPEGPRNIVVFGETGAGKSSLINMLAYEEIASVSNGATGCTFEALPHSITIGNAKYILWDTAGLNEGEAGSVPGDQALLHLRDLVKKLDGGLSLLIYCIRGSRYRDILKANYDLFKKIICQGEIPVVLVVTGLENEEPMEKWWDDNRKDFSKHRMEFDGHACITTTKGKRDKEGIFVFEEEYSTSRDRVQKLIRGHCPPCAWVVDSELWLDRIEVSMTEYRDNYNLRYSLEEDSKILVMFLFPFVTLFNFCHRVIDFVSQRIFLTFCGR